MFGLRGSIGLLVCGAMVSLAWGQARPATGAAAKATPGSETPSDLRALEAANLKADDAPGLLSYIRQRTLNDENSGKIQAIIRRFSSEDFEERLKASEEAVSFGPSAISPLRKAAQSDPDFEVAYRAAQCLKRLEKQASHTAIAVAAVRQLNQLQPDELATTFLGYLPMADSSEVADLVQAGLTKAALKNGTPNPAIVAALGDGNSLRRTAAVLALLLGGPDGQRIRIPAAFNQVKATIAAEKDAEQRFRMVEPLLQVVREKQGVDLLLEVLPNLPRGRLWQAEDYLRQLAGTDVPQYLFGKSPESMTKARDTWAAWWKTAAAKTDLTKFDYKPRISGQMVLVMLDYRSGNSGYISMLGPDLKEKQRITGMQYPVDIAFLPNGNMVIPETNGGRLSVRDATGKQLVSRNLVNRGGGLFYQPQSVQVLPNENLLVCCRAGVVELKKDSDEQVMQFTRPNNHDVCGAKRLADGRTLVLLQNGPQYAIFLDAKGTEIQGAKLKTGQPFYQSDIEISGPDRVIITEQNQVVEYDLKQNKAIWTRAANNPRSVQRLPNGNTIITEMANPGQQTTRVIEVAPAGEIVWEYASDNEYQIYRSLRR